MPRQNSLDPRDRLVREKYFSLRPKPLERWLWAQGIPASAERVFWLHWQEGHQRGDWCSELPLSRVARECGLDISTVTKAYQRLARLGCVRRIDPGRDPANPFHQAVAVTEVRIPGQLLAELNRHPSRRTGLVEKPEKSVRTDMIPPAVTTAKPQDPFTGLRGRERIKALTQLIEAMSAAERIQYHEAQRKQLAQMSFDADSRLSAADQGRVLQLLSLMGGQGIRADAVCCTVVTPTERQRRKISMFELARVSREIQAASDSASAAELLRQVIWSIEEGPLRRFTLLHALNIALKKIREGAWTRPNRMPPNWARSLSSSASLETCRRA